MGQRDGAPDELDQGLDGPVRPERPSVTGQAPAPVGGAAAVPRAVRRTLTTWQASLTLSGFTLLTMVLTRRGLSNHLREQLALRDPTIPATTLETAAPRVVLAALLALLVVALLEWGLLRAFARRRAWARYAFIPAVALHGAVATLASLLVPSSVWQGWLLLLTLVAGMLMAVVGTVQSFLPGVSDWRRSASEAPH